MEDNINFEKSIKEILDKDKGFIREEVNKQLKQRIIDSLTWNLQQEVGGIVEDYFKNELKDDIKGILQNHKVELLRQIENASVEIAAGVAKSMVKKATENLTSSYKVGNMLKDLFE